MSNYPPPGGQPGPYGQGQQPGWNGQPAQQSYGQDHQPGWNGQPAQHSYGQGQPLPPPGFLNLTLQGNEATSNMVAPNVMIDGRLVPATYGSNTYPLVPGTHHISIYAQWMRKYGQAEMPVQIVAGQQVPVFYRAPLHQFTTGSIGHEKQKAKGKGCLFGVLGVFVLVILLGVIAAIAAS